MLEWIDPKRKQPNDLEYVIVCSSTYGVCAAEYQKQFGFDTDDEEMRPTWYIQKDYHDSVPFEDVTAWMPIPKAPN